LPTLHRKHDTPNNLSYWVVWAFRHRKANTALLIVLVMASMGLTYALPFLVKVTIDALEQGRALSAVARLLLVSLCVMVLRSIVAAVFKVQYSKRAQETLLDMRTLVFDTFHSYPLSRITSVSTGDVCTRLRGDIDVVGNLVVQGIPVMAMAFAELLCMAGILIWFCPYLAAVLAFEIPVYVLILCWTWPRLQKLSRDIVIRQSSLLDLIIETFRGIRTIKIFKAEGHHSAMIRTGGSELVDASIRSIKLSNRLQLATELVEAMVWFTVMLLGARLVLQSRMSLGTLVAFYTIVSRVSRPLRTSYESVVSLAQAKASMERLGELLICYGEESSKRTSVEYARANTGPCRVRISRLVFSYNDERGKVLDGVDFIAESDQITGIVGPSGSGKTTLLGLLSGLYAPSEGDITIDGIPVGALQCSPESLPVVLVDQEPLLFKCSIIDNLRYAKRDLTYEEAAEVCQEVGIHREIEALPMQYDTVIGMGSGSLSSGQKQRLCLARAFLHGAPVLLLDEITAFIDAGSAKLIVAALKRKCLERTIIVSSHDPYLIGHCTKVYELREGRLTCTRNCSAKSYTPSCYP
jgi:ABC-type bacteriocin/lantibiotic exporter with double-glycine peptidase domain